MRILLVHNRYQRPGGEDLVFEAERALLARHGHDVAVYERHNEEIAGYSPWRKADLMRRTIWATDSARAIRDILVQLSPEVVHFYNTFPLVSPAAYSVCHSADVPVVQTLPNYRLICPSAQLRRNGRICEDCIDKHAPWPGVRFGCYRDSPSQTGVVAAMLVVHRMIGTWKNRVDKYIALTEFSRGKLIEGGLPAHKIAVKPNFVHPDPGPKSGEGGYAVFVGRLSPEKGIATLLHAWEMLPTIPLKIVGDGPLMPLVEETVRKPGGTLIEPLGWCSRRDVLGLVKEARLLVIPSEWYEGFPLTIVEAFACGTPVVGSQLGSVGEVIQHGKSGMHFVPGDAADLAETVKHVWSDKALRRLLGSGARSQFEAHYTAERNYEILMDIFKNAIAARR